MSDFPLKSISKDAVPSALDKARWYRALNEPLEAESICRDVLEVDSKNQEALARLLLSLTDQFPHGLSGRFREAKELVGRLTSEYEREYYTGILHERRAKCQHRQGTPGCGHLAFEGLKTAMEHYERAHELNSGAHDDAVLRWNTCARVIDANADIVPEPASQAEPVELE